MTGTRPRFALALLELVGPDACAALAAALSGPAAAAAVPLRTALRGVPGETVPERRLRALREAGADVVLMIEDTTLPGPAWAEGLQRAFAQDDVAMAWGPVAVDPALPARFRALGRLEYGRFDGRRTDPATPGNAVAVRSAAVFGVLAPGEGIIEHKLALALQNRGMKVVMEPLLGSVYARPDRLGARLGTRFDHGRIYGSGCGGNRVTGALRAVAAMPVLCARALRAAATAAPAGVWLGELPWIVLMAAAWSAGELAGQVSGPRRTAGSWT
jgi:hypothetical protein